MIGHGSVMCHSTIVVFEVTMARIATSALPARTTKDGLDFAAANDEKTFVVVRCIFCTIRDNVG